ncbi:SdrD B-like domain-containing protein [Bacillus sp. FSL K6-0268]|uniref:SdrD B-like domain-containing protein n=1 Tax=Bacillus sp. FSL K6-0268 TaxID=2921449 RepID=UPI0030F4FB3C
MKLNKIMYGTLLSTALLSSQYVMTTPTYAAENTGVVWEDKNQNGKMDAGESGINNIKMDLFTVNGSLIKSSTTDSQGKYSFGDVADGKYYAKVNVPQNYRFGGSVPYFGSDGLTKYITVTQNNLKDLNVGLVKINDQQIEQQFKWSLVGYMDNEFVNMTFTPKNLELQIKFNLSIPNIYSTNSHYANIKVKKSTGEVVYDRAINNAQQLADESKMIPMKAGYTIEIVHTEGDRLRYTIDNGETTKLGSPYTAVIKKYEVTKNSLKELQ